jgi:Fe-S oxidoreductase
MDQFYPHVGVATIELLQKLGLDVKYPIKQTCCEQALANSGAEKPFLYIRISLKILMNLITLFLLQKVVLTM